MTKDTKAPSPAAGSGEQRSSPLLDLFRRHPRAVAFACFFLSGATGLVYEVVWSRRLTLIFGVTVLAVSTVLAAFLGGLALGSVIFGRIADRRRDPLRLYAVLEGAVGLICFATPWLFVLVERSYVGIHPAIADHPWLLRVVRFLLCAVVILVPAMLMGGTLPALSRALVRKAGQVGTSIAALYGINTLGAVAGTVAAGFLLIPAVGIRDTIYLAAVVNLAVALVAFALHMAQAEQALPVAAPEQARPPHPRVRRAYLALLLAYGLSGAAALIYEVAWTRVLCLAFGTSTYAFSAMLAAFLAGIGLGSIVLARSRWTSVDGLRQPLLWFGVIEIAIGASVTFLTPLLDRMPFAFLALFRWIGPRFWPMQFAELAVCLLVMLLPALLMGYAFPLVTRLATESLGVVGRKVGTVYAANTLGTVVGSFLAGFVLIPSVGVRYALAMGVSLNVLVGVAYVATNYRRRPRLAAGGLVLAVVAGAAWFVLPGWNRAVLSSGAYIYHQYYVARGARARMEDKEILYYRDALTGTLSVTRVAVPGQDRPLLSLQINGKTDASTADLGTQLLHAHLPALLHPEPRSALVVGLASGCTLGAVERHEELERIDCVEIEPAMAEVTEFFREINHDCLSDPRVNLVYDDARNFILVTPRRYDLITCEPSNPWISGVANLFTRDYFQLCREHLTPTGLFCQWVPLYNLAPRDLACILATFREVFPHCSLWLFPYLSSDAYLVGTLTAQEIDVAALAERARRPTVAAGLSDAHVRDSWDLLSAYLFGSETFVALSEGARLNTDDLPLLEFSSPLSLYSRIARVGLAQLLATAKASSPPLGRCGQASETGYHDALTGLWLREPWTPPREETLRVRRLPEGYAAEDPRAAVQATAHLVCGLGSGEAEVYAWRLGDEPATSIPTDLGGEADQQMQVGEHLVSVWTRPGSARDAAWVARWTCDDRQRAYLVVARPGADGRTVAARDALRQAACDH